MAPRNSPSAGNAARSRGRDEWNCEVCTLLNNWRERRCGACDSERPAGADSQPAEWSCEVCTLVNEWAARRCAACEHERPTPTASGVSRGTSDPSQLSRLAHSSSVLDTKDSVTAVAASPARPSRKRALSPVFQRSNGPLTTHPERERSPTLSPPSRLSGAKKEAADPLGVQQYSNDPAASVEGLPEVPTFNLLSFVTDPAASLAQPPNEDHGVEAVAPFSDTHTTSPSFNLLGGMPTVDLTAATGDETTSPSAVEDSETQLAKAGLLLSDPDSENDDEARGREKRLLRRRRSLQDPSTALHSPDASTRELQEEWECPICTNNNAAHSARCELCNTIRDPSSARDNKTNDPAKDSIEFSVCTHMNPKSATSCDVCNIGIPGAGTDTTFTCVVCTNINPGHLDQCEMCETKRQTVPCPICTTLNAIDRKRCEVCESIIDKHSPTKEPRPNSDVYIDLAISQNHEYEEQQGRYRGDSLDSASHIDQESVGDFDDEFEDPYQSYATSSRPSSRETNQGRNHHHRDDIEDISDNEMYGRMPADIHQPAQSRRPELREFEHLLSVDDARLDYQCQIDYRSMFAESSRSRSYADRLQKRRRESQKRRRAAAENPHGHRQAGSGRGKASGKKKATKAGSKKTKAAERRASTGRPAAKSAKKPRNGETPRRSSAPAIATGINHYDAVGEDFGEDVTTMAWEGVGSAGYF